MILSHNMAIPQSTLLLFTFQRLHTSIRHNLNNIVFMPKPLSKCNKVLQKTQTSKQNNATKSKTQSPCLHGAWGYVTYKVFREEKIKKKSQKKYKIKKKFRVFGYPKLRNIRTVSKPKPKKFIGSGTRTKNFKYFGSDTQYFGSVRGFLVRVFGYGQF